MRGQRREAFGFWRDQRLGGGLRLHNAGRKQRGGASGHKESTGHHVCDPYVLVIVGDRLFCAVATLSRPGAGPVTLRASPRQACFHPLAGQQWRHPSNPEQAQNRAAQDPARKAYRAKPLSDTASALARKPSRRAGHRQSRQHRRKPALHRQIRHPVGARIAQPSLRNRPPMAGPPERAEGVRRIEARSSTLAEGSGIEGQ